MTAITDKNLKFFISLLNFFAYTLKSKTHTYQELLVSRQVPSIDSKILVAATSQFGIQSCILSEGKQVHALQVDPGIGEYISKNGSIKGISYLQVFQPEERTIFHIVAVVNRIGREVGFVGSLGCSCPGIGWRPAVVEKVGTLLILE